MANTGKPRTRLVLVLVLAAMGIGCAPTTMSLPMHAAGYGPAQASASRTYATGGEPSATRPSAYYSGTR